MTKVCHMTSVHALNDTRIFIKECKTLRDAGYDVTLIVQHVKDEMIDGIFIKAIDKPRNRLERMLKSTRQVYKRALECDADIYHFHDPELIPVGLRLKCRGKTVIYDAHEDVPRQILSKEWIPSSLRISVSSIVEIVEDFSIRRFDAIIVPTDHLWERVFAINKNTVAVKNYPRVEYNFPINKKNKVPQICYVSSHLSLKRGIVPIIRSIENINATLVLAGKMEPYVYNIVRKLEGWKKTNYVGYVSQEDAYRIMRESVAGLVIFSLEPNYVNALPTKMFEYMSFGLPVIVNDIPILREIVDKYKCGICVKPMDSDEISNAIRWLLENPESAFEMGERGRHAVKTEFNWQVESTKLLKLYSDLLNKAE